MRCVSSNPVPPHNIIQRVSTDCCPVYQTEDGLPPPVKAAPGPNGEEYYYYYYYYDDEEGVEEEQS